MDLDRDALDRWITGGRYSAQEAEVWCQSKECPTYGKETITVWAESEYGSSWWTPEECPECGGELDLEKPEVEE